MNYKADMITFDHNRYDVIGIVTKLGASQNAQIIGMGLSDRETGVFIPIQSIDRNKTFPTRGCVFAFDYLKHNPHLENECVCICVKPNNNPNIVNGEDYVWDWKNKTYIYAKKLRKLNTHLGEDGGENYNKLLKEGLLQSEDTTYFICADMIYRLDHGIRLIPFWNLSKVSSYIITYNSITYLINDIMIPEEGKIDLTSDNQLLEWYKKNILRKEWNKIYEAKDFKSVDDVVVTELQRLKIPTNVYESRLARIMKFSANISLTFEELEDLSTAPWFTDVILNTMNMYAEQYINRIKEEHKNEISALESKHKQVLLELDAKFRQEAEIMQHQIDEKRNALKVISENIQEKTSKLNLLSDEIEDKGKIIKELDARKDSIIADFSVIKEVLSPGSLGISPIAKQSINLIDFDKKNEREFSTVGPFKKNIESLVMKNNGMKISADEIVVKMATHNVVLFPDNETLLATMQATRRCRYIVSYVGVNWKSFDDLWESGLSIITTEAMHNPEIIYFLVLENINMSFIPCYIQPILDMKMGLTNFFPGTTIEFPKNMRIFCTRTKDTVIPVTEFSLKGIGCISTYEEKNLEDRGIAEGYLPVSVFSDLPIDDIYVKKNNYDLYIDD